MHTHTHCTVYIVHIPHIYTIVCYTSHPHTLRAPFTYPIPTPPHPVNPSRIPFTRTHTEYRVQYYRPPYHTPPHTLHPHTHRVPSSVLPATLPHTPIHPSHVPTQSTESSTTGVPTTHPHTPFTRTHTEH